MGVYLRVRLKDRHEPKGAEAGWKKQWTFLFEWSIDLFECCQIHMVSHVCVIV